MAIFQYLGTTPGLIQAVKMWQIGTDVTNASLAKTSWVCHRSKRFSSVDIRKFVENVNGMYVTFG